MIKFKGSINGVEYDDASKFQTDLLEMARSGKKITSTTSEFYVTDDDEQKDETAENKESKQQDAPKTIMTPFFDKAGVEYINKLKNLELDDFGSILDRSFENNKEAVKNIDPAVADILKPSIGKILKQIEHNKKEAEEHCDDIKSSIGDLEGRLKLNLKLIDMFDTLTDFYTTLNKSLQAAPAKPKPDATPSKKPEKTNLWDEVLADLNPHSDEDEIWNLIAKLF